MTLPALLAALGLSLSGFAVAADKAASARDHAPRHGGVVVEVKDMD